MSERFALVQGKRMRVTRLDDCGNVPSEGTDCSQAVSRGFVTVSLSAEVESGTDITQLNANGELIVNERSVDQLRHFELEIEFAEVDPELFEIVTHARIEENDDGEGVGIRFAEGGAEDGFALEVWSGVSGQECPPDASVYLGYMLLPWVMPGAPGDITIENDAITFTVGGFSKSGGGWGTGPYNVIDDSSGVGGGPSPLSEPIQQDEHYLMRMTTVDAPDDEPGCQPMPEAS